MYIQVTSKCNMSCDHCGMNCTAQGEDMTFATFKAAIKHTDMITIGGGEPTIHPDFGNFLLYAIGHCDHVHIITNGSMTDTSLALARLSEGSETFGAKLSLDSYHDPIDPRVIDAFKGSIRDNDENPIMAGRCDWGDEDICICEGDAFVLPNGDVNQCGCGDSPKVGSVYDEELKPLTNDEEDWGEWLCHKKLKETA